jgi:hypothetical protein
MVKRIVLSGVQNSGKSTQMKALAEKLNDLGYSATYGIKVPERTDGSISRRAVDHGFKINENGDFSTQYNICLAYSLFDMETTKNAEMQGYEFLVLDRSILDHVIYCNAMENISREDKMFASYVGINHAMRYPTQQLWICEPVGKIDVDGYRSGNKEFQDRINSLFTENILQRKIGETVLKNYVQKGIYRLPSNDEFSKEESIDIRNDLILKQMKIDGLL